jgi:hypothetical protein
VGTKFSSPVQNGTGDHPASYTIGTESFPGGKEAGVWRSSPTPSSAKVKERAELYFYSPQGLRGLFWGEFYLYLYLKKNSVMALRPTG